MIDIRMAVGPGTTSGYFLCKYFNFEHLGMSNVSILMLFLQVYFSEEYCTKLSELAFLLK